MCRDAPRGGFLDPDCYYHNIIELSTTKKAAQRAWVRNARFPLVSNRYGPNATVAGYAPNPSLGQLPFPVAEADQTHDHGFETAGICRIRLRARWLLGVTMEIAASVEYQTIPPPEGLPDGMKPLQGATLRFLSIKSIDRFEVIAALWQTQDKSPEDTTLLVQVHGSGDNLTGLPLQAVAQAFSSRGYAALTINTRQHDERVNTDNFFDVRRDIEAAVATAKALGYASIVLAGHSLGTVQVAFYAATDWDPAIRAVILMAPFAKLPWKSRHVLIQDEGNYHALAQASRASLQAGTVAEPLRIGMRWTWNRQTPVTPQHFLTYRDEWVSTADSTYWVPRVPHPILLLRDEADGVILPFEPHMLVSAARAEGSLAHDITYVQLPNNRPPSREGHLFTDNVRSLIEAVAAWLAERHL